jgi:hypothetical protein
MKKKDFRACDGYHKHRAGSGSMSNTIGSSENSRHLDSINGIHGIARARRGLKHATVSLSRRNAKKEIAETFYRE